MSVERLKNLYRKNKYIIVFISLLAISLLIMLLPYLIAGKPFSYGGDVRTQWYPFYYTMRNETISALKGGSLPFYSWNMFLGSNLWASKSYYGLFDLFNLVSYFFKTHYYIIYEIQTCAKIMVAGITFYFYISELGSEKKWSILSALCYALSSWAIYFSGQPGFLSFYCLVPLYFLGMEHYLQKNKKVLFILATFLLICSSYYFFFTISMFSPIYFIYRYYNLRNTLKGFFLSALKLIMYYLIGVFMGGIILFPTFYYIISNDRIGSFSNYLFFDDPKIYLHQLVSMLAPSHAYIYKNNVFQTQEHISSEICLYAGTIIPLLLPQIFKEKNKTFKKSTIILYMILILLMTPIGSSLMHGFSEYSFRWMMLFILCNIVISNHYLNHLEDLNIRVLKISAIVECLIVVVCFGLGIYTIKSNIKENLTQFYLFMIILAFVAINMYFLLKHNDFKRMIFTTFVELTVFSYLCIGMLRFPYCDSWDFINNVTQVLEYEKGGFKYYLNSLKEENASQYYRVYVPVATLYWDYSYNMNLFYGINGLTTYDSTFAPSFTKMRNMAYSKISVNDSGWEFDIRDSNLINFLNTKYAVTTTTSEIPFENYEIIDDCYLGGLIISENLDYRPLGITYNKLITYDDYYEKYEKNTQCFNNAVIANADDIGDIQILLGDSGSEFMNIQYEKNYLYGNISVKTNSFMIVSLPYDEGWKVLVNGTKAKIYEVNGGMMGFAISSGENNIEMYFVPKGLKAGAVLSIAGGFGFIIIIWNSLLKTKLHRK